MRLRPVLLVLATGILSWHFPIAAASQDSGWSTYSNARFGFVVCFPSAFDGQGEARNGDGPKGEFYIKRVVRQDQVISLELLYPAALHARYAPLVAAMLRCFAVDREPAF